MTKIGCKRTEPRKPLRRTRIVKNPPKPRRSALRVRIDPLDALFSKYIRLRDKGTCQRCGKYIGMTQGLHCSHFIGRSNQRSRYDSDNCVALCFGCHQYLDSHHLEFTNWTKQRLGEKEFDLLTARANSNHFKIDRQAIEIYLRAKIKELEHA